MMSDKFFDDSCRSKGSDWVILSLQTDDVREAYRFETQKNEEKMSAARSGR